MNGGGRSRAVRARVVAFALAGTLIAVALLPRVESEVGPFVVTAAARPSLSGHTTVRLIPLGSIRLDTHAGPVAIDMRLEELRADEAEAIARNPQILAGLEREIEGDAKAILFGLLWRSALAGLAGGVAGAILARRSHWRDAIIGAVASLALLGATATSVVGTFDPQAVAEPRYSGLLANAPTAVGDVNAIIGRFGEYRAQLTDLVGNVATLYRAGRELPDFSPADNAVRVLHVSDVHNNPQAFDLIERLVEDFAVDVVVDTGDISDWGTEAEAQLVDPIGRMPVPYVFVRGNHDSADTAAAVAAQPNAVVLEAEPVTVAGLTFWGVGDPRFTPDKSSETGVDVEREAIEAFAPVMRRQLRRDNPSTVDVVLVHDPRAAARVGDLVPLVLAGHTHEPRQGVIGEATLLVEGSTGGAGLRALRGEFPEPLTCSVLYFDPASDQLVAYDRISLEGLGGSGASIARHIVDTPPKPRPGSVRRWGEPFVPI
ncbi:MAG: metallophosphoesterase [Actinobacteria bacterium]|nr:metallophosphoesterase [Actinomycetota bacterium]